MLDHAEALLPGTPSEADLRRSISAACYALFHLITGQAAERIAGPNAPLQGKIRRSAQHTTLRKVCEAFAFPAPAGPKGFESLIATPIRPELARLASSAVHLQDHRHTADYDLETAPSLAEPPRIVPWPGAPLRTGRPFTTIPTPTSSSPPSCLPTAGRSGAELQAMNHV